MTIVAILAAVVATYLIVRITLKRAFPAETK